MTIDRYAQPLIADKLNRKKSAVGLFQAEQIKKMEQDWFDQGHRPFGLMQQAAWQMTQQIVQNYDPTSSISAQSPKALVWVGTGNNGGDGWLIAKYLQQFGWQVQVLVVAQDRPSHSQICAKNNPQSDNSEKDNFPTATDHDFRFADLANCPYQYFKKALQMDHENGESLPSMFMADVYIDAIFGIGLNRAPFGTAKTAIETLNQAAAKTGAWVVAVDIPSGLFASTGQVIDDIAVKADLTLCLIARKLGLHTKDGLDYCGDIIDIALIPHHFSPKAQLLSHPTTLPKRKQNSHKGSFGHVLIIGGNQINGSQGMGGAVILASASAMAAGAGKLTAACHQAFHGALLTSLPDAMTVDLQDQQGVCELIKAADMIAIGMGLGRDADAEALFERYVKAAINHNKPLVIDADGLYHLATLNEKHHDLVKQLKDFSRHQTLYLTPHSGEAARLLACSADEIEADRVAAIYSCQNQFDGDWVLKGAGSLVLQDGLWVCDTGNSGMATAGMGDVLSGVISGLISQKDLAQLPIPLAQSVLIHGLAGDFLVSLSDKSVYSPRINDLAIGHRGLQAQDMPAAIRHVMAQLSA